MKTTIEILDEIRKRCNAATPGNWTASRDLMAFEISATEGPDENVCSIGREDYGRDHDDEIFKKRWNDSEFIASSKDDVEKLEMALRFSVDALEDVMKDTGEEGYLRLWAKENLTQIHSILAGEER